MKQRVLPLLSVLSLMAGTSVDLQAFPGFILLTGGSLAGQSLEGDNWVIQVNPGAPISGNVICTTNNEMGSNAVAPFGCTWTWGDRQTDIGLIHSWLPTGSNTWNVSFDLPGPTASGTYYLLFGFEGEFDLAQVFSCTNWATNAYAWNDGNDYFDMSDARLAAAHETGYAGNWPYLLSGGYETRDVPVMPIKVLVGETADLELSGLSVSRSGSAKRSFTACSFTLSNHGPTSLSSEGVMVDYFLSSDTTFGNSDDRWIGDTGFTLSIASGANNTITLNAAGLANMSDLWTGGLTPNGNYYLYATVRTSDGSPGDPAPSNDRARTTASFSYTGEPTDPDRDIYAVVVSDATWGDSEWRVVATALQTKHGPDSAVFFYSGAAFPETLRQQLASAHPHHVCFVVRPEEVTEDFVRNAHQMLRALDSDPYGDAVWGIVTGFTATEALRLANASGFVVRNTLMKTAGAWLEYFESGTYHSETTTGIMWTRANGGAIDKRTDGPVDDTQSLVSSLNGNTVDIMVTSGHATETEWQLHYPMAGPEGYFRSSCGQFYGQDATGTRHDINSTNPKIYHAAGNCLIGHIPENSSRDDSLALGWLDSGGAAQLAGYVVTNWFGYMGWGVGDYFVKLQDRFTFAESIYLNNQALLFDQRQGTPGFDPSGLTYDRDVFVLYGDPALDARLHPVTDAVFEQTLQYSSSGGQIDFTFEIVINRAGTVSRPVIGRLPFRIESPTIHDDAGRPVEVVDDMVLVDVWHSGEADLQAGQSWTVYFSAHAVDPAPLDEWLDDKLVAFPSELRERLADADGDRILNIMEYAFGTKVAVPDQSSLPIQGRVESGTGRPLVSTVLRGDDDALIVEAEVSSDAQNWESVRLRRNPGGWTVDPHTSTLQVVSETALADGLWDLTLADDSGGTTRFLRFAIDYVIP